MEAGGGGNGYTGDGQEPYQKCTTHTRHRTRVRTLVPVGLQWSRHFCLLGNTPNRPNGGYDLLPKRAKKHSIAANRGELKATFGPRLRYAAVQQLKQ